jgi:hypothetical protein
MQQPLLSGRTVAGRHDQRRKRIRLASGNVHALAADADQLGSADGPLLAGTALC